MIEAVPENPNWESERSSNVWKSIDNKKRRVEFQVTAKKIATEKIKDHGRKK